MSIVEYVNNAMDVSLPDDWKRNRAFRCHVCLIQEDDGTFSAIVLNLPGAGSCGDTEDEALQNVVEAVQGIIESYAASHEEIPWKDSESEDIPEGAKLRWILVNA